MLTPRRLATVAAALAIVVPTTSGGARAATVDTGPVRVVTGEATGLHFPTGVARGPQGELYAANSDAASVTVHAAGATGDAAPARTIAGTGTGLIRPSGVAVDGNGFVYVTDDGDDAVRVFAPGASGDVAPVKTIRGDATTLVAPAGVAVTADGSVVVASSGSDSVLLFAPAARGDVAPTLTLAGPSTGLVHPKGLAIGPTGVLYVGNRTTVTVYDHVAAGDVAPTRTLGGLMSDLRDVYGLAVDDAGDVYAGSLGSVRLVVFGPTGTGNVTPLQILTGPTSRIGHPAGVAVAPDRSVAVVDLSEDTLATYAPLVPRPTTGGPVPVPGPVATAPSAVRALAVAGTVRASRRTIRWVAPTSTGGAPLVRYEVVVRKGARTFRTARLVPAQRSYVLRTRKLGRGGYTALVRAVNAHGAGPYASRRFAIRR